MDTIEMIYLRKFIKIVVIVFIELFGMALMIVCGLLAFPLIGGLIDIVKEPYFYKTFRFYAFLFFTIIVLNIIIYQPFSFFHRLLSKKRDNE